MAIRFENQRVLLEYLGKNPNDRSLVQRMERRGEVYREDGGYYLVERAETKAEQKTERTGTGETKQSVDEQKYLELKSKYERLGEEYKKAKKKADECMGCYDHMKFFYEKFLVWKKFVDWKAFWQAQYNNSDKWTQDTTEMVKPQVYERYNFVYGEMEKAECDEVQHIINEIEGEKQKNIEELPF